MPCVMCGLMNLSVKAFTAALLAGGRSTRMGQDKAWLPWRGQPLWRVQLEKLAALAPTRLIVSCRADQGFAGHALDVIPDAPDNPGPLGAIASCLREAQMPLLVLAVDMPFMTAELLSLLLQHVGQPRRGVVFQHHEGFEPLCAVYPMEMLAVLDQALARHQHRMQDVIAASINAGLMEALPLPAQHESAFFNANTPEEWTLAQQPT